MILGLARRPEDPLLFRVVKLLGLCAPIYSGGSELILGKEEQGNWARCPFWAFPVHEMPHSMVG